MFLEFRDMKFMLYSFFHYAPEAFHFWKRKKDIFFCKNEIVTAEVSSVRAYSWKLLSNTIIGFS